MNKIMPEQELHANQVPQEDEIDLSQLFGVLLDSKWLIGGITAMVTLGALAYCFLATPIFRSDTLLQVETKGSGNSSLDALSSMMDTVSEADTEIEIIKSRSVIGAMVDELHLDTVAEPDYFPLLGQPLARLLSGRPTDPPHAPLMGLSGFAWGGEQIQVQRLVVPSVWVGYDLDLVAGDGNQFKLYSPDADLILTGQVGETAISNDKQVEIFVSALKARPGTHFKVIRQPRLAVITNLQESLNVSEQGKQTGIIEVSLEDDNRFQLAAILQSLANNYLRQDIEARSAEAEKTLDFLNRQLPTLKADLDAAETRLNDYQSKKGSIDLNLETQGILAKNADLEKQLSELKLKQASLAEKFTANHPAMLTLQQQQQQLEGQLNTIDNEIKEMPVEIREAVRLQRDVKVANELYFLLLNKAQEMKVVKAGTIGNSRIIDPAVVPYKPAKPKKTLVLALGLLLGFLCWYQYRFCSAGSAEWRR